MAATARIGAGQINPAPAGDSGYTQADFCG